VEGLALKIYKSFFATSLYLLALLLVFGLAVFRSVNTGGLILGWSGIQVYLFCFCKTIGRSLDGNTPTGPARPPAAMGAALFRLSLLLLVLVAGATRGMAVFSWTIGTTLAVFLGWLGFLLYWHYHKTA